MDKGDMRRDITEAEWHMLYVQLERDHERQTYPIGGQDAKRTTTVEAAGRGQSLAVEHGARIW